jgi:hypothetical protein
VSVIFCLHDINVILAYGMETVSLDFITKSLIKEVETSWFQFWTTIVLVIALLFRTSFGWSGIDSQPIRYGFGVGCLGHHSVFKIKGRPETDDLCS